MSSPKLSQNNSNSLFWIYATVVGLGMIIFFVNVGKKKKEEKETETLPLIYQTGSDKGVKSDVSVNVKGCYTPPLSPVKFCLDANGKFSVNTARKIVTPLGTFELASSADYSPNNRMLLVKISTSDSMYFYHVKKDDKLRIKTEKGVLLEFENDRVELKIKKDENLTIVFQEARKPTTSFVNNLFYQFFEIKDGDKISDILWKFEDKFKSKKRGYNSKIKRYIFFNSANEKVLTIYYRGKTGEVYGVKVYREIRSSSLEDVKLQYFNHYRSTILTRLSDFKKHRENSDEIVIVNPKDCGIFSSCYPRLYFDTSDENNYNCTVIELIFKPFNGKTCIFC